MRPRRPKQYCLQLDIALWCKTQIEHSIWDESLLFSNCARSLEYSSSSTLAGLSYHICGKLEVAFKASPSSQHQHCTDEAQKAETVLSAVIYIYIYFRLVRPTIWHENTKKAIPGLETTLVCQLSLNDTPTVKDLLANKFLPFTFE